MKGDPVGADRVAQQFSVDQARVCLAAEEVSNCIRDTSVPGVIGLAARLHRVS
ncbi:hypothetical protein O3Q52_17105 [Streptomyces sp. ActVer]|uniref:hypothetical protein n=1 Tax=Streptomyces sp. ActVer TaxID=3014558 RepID=UPI0022B4A387|nr:hypothetical protein [Streptomyces sp. ActVer]MCZ4509886.1 hypothetical protein [Streptomyces sp. ActVer]